MKIEDLKIGVKIKFKDNLNYITVEWFRPIRDGVKGLYNVAGILASDGLPYMGEVDLGEFEVLDPKKEELIKNNMARIKELRDIINEYERQVRRLQNE